MRVNHSENPKPDQNGEAKPGQLYRFLRYSHIFSSAVREILETKFLGEVSKEHITLPQFHLLKLISLNGHHQVGEIADFLGVSSPAATKNIDKLERLGLVSREPCKDDRRATLLSATDKARRLVQRYERTKADRLAPVLARFRAEEIEELSRLMERFSILLFAREASSEGICLRCAAYGETNCPIGHVQGNCPYEKIRSRNGTDTEDQEEMH